MGQLCTLEEQQVHIYNFHKGKEVEERLNLCLKSFENYRTSGSIVNLTWIYLVNPFNPISCGFMSLLFYGRMCLSVSPYLIPFFTHCIYSYSLFFTLVFPWLPKYTHPPHLSHDPLFFNLSVNGT